MTSFEAAARGEDLKDLLEHIAWTDTIKPEFDKLRSLYSNLLSKSVLGQRIMDTAGNIVTSEQLAARIEGLEFTAALFERILRRGKSALDEASSLSVN